LRASLSVLPVERKGVFDPSDQLPLRSFLRKAKTVQVHPYITSQLAAARRADMFAWARQQHTVRQAHAGPAESQLRVASRLYFRLAA
jgi:hypothetical protein